MVIMHTQNNICQRFISLLYYKRIFTSVAFNCPIISIAA